MKTLIEFVNTASEIWWTNVFHATWQAVIIGGILLAVTFLGRRWPAPLRYGLLLLALFKFAFPPMLSVPTGLFSAVGPALTSAEKQSRTSEAPIWATPLSSVPSTAEPEFAFSERIGDAAKLALEPNPSRNSNIGESRELVPAIHWKSWLMLVHIAGCFTVLLWIGWQLIQLRRITRHAETIKDGELCATFAAVSEQLNLRRLPRLMASSEVHAPIAFGLLHPTVMLPTSVLQKMPLAEIRTILAHELAHYRRSDLWINWVQLVLMAIWWFNPVLWLLNRALRKVREDCCDDLLLARGLTSNAAYCDVLIRAAAQLSRRCPGSATLGFADDIHPLGRRVARIMDRTIRRCPKISAMGIFTLIILGGVILPGLRSQETKPLGPGVTVENKGNPAVTAEPAAPVTAEAFEKIFASIKWVGESHVHFEQMRTLSLKLGANAVPFLLRKLEKQPGRSDDGKSVEDRRKAALALGFISADTAIPRLMAALADDASLRFDAELGRDVQSIRVNAVAADALGQIGPRAAEAVPSLIEAAKVGNPRALVALARVAPDSNDVLRTLHEALKDRTEGNQFPLEGNYRLAALQALAIAAAQNPGAIRPLVSAMGEGEKLGGSPLRVLVQSARDYPQIVPTVIGYLSSQDQALRINAIVAVSAFGQFARPAEPLLLEALQDSNSQIRFLAVSAVGQIGAAPEKVIPALKKALNDSVSMVRTAALMSLAKFGEAARDILPTLVGMLDGTNAWAAMSALGDFGPLAEPAVPALIKILESPDAGARKQAAIPLGKIGPKAKPAVPALIQALKDSDANVRVNAAFSLWQIDGRTDVVGILINRLKSDEDLNPVERDAKWRRILDIKRLADVGPEAKAAVPTLTEITKEDDYDLRAEAEDALSRIRGETPSKEKRQSAKSKAPTAAELFKQLEFHGSFRKHSQAKVLDELVRAPSAIQFLIRELENRTMPSQAQALESRRKAVWVLREMGAACKPALPTLIKALEDDDEQVAHSAAGAIGAIGPEAKEALAPLIEAFKFKNSSAARALVKIAPDSSEVALLLIEAFEDKGQPSRDQLLYVLSDLKCEKKRLEAALLAAQEEEDTQIRNTSAYALYRIGADSKAALKAIETWRMNQVAEQAAQKDKSQVPQLIAQLRNPSARNEDLAALNKLIQLGPDAAEAVPALIDYLKNPKSPSRGNAANALGAIGPAAKEAVPLLIEAVQEDDRAVSISAAWSLGKIGPAAKPAIPALLQALSDAEPIVRLQAAAALWRIDHSLTATSVSALTEMLEQPPKGFEQTSFYIVKVLGEIGPPAKSALPAVVRIYEKAEDGARWNAATALCRIDPQRIATLLPHFIQALNDSTHLHRSAVANGLGEIGELANAAVPALKAASAGSDPLLQGEARKALAKISPSGN
jgi:HEAT repeat protein/beta-lactamase regulating signal transducer with metallopeptidase domain